MEYTEIYEQEGTSIDEAYDTSSIDTNNIMRGEYPTHTMRISMALRNLNNGADYTEMVRDSAEFSKFLLRVRRYAYRYDVTERKLLLMLGLL